MPFSWAIIWIHIFTKSLKLLFLLIECFMFYIMKSINNNFGASTHFHCSMVAFLFNKRFFLFFLPVICCKSLQVLYYWKALLNFIIYLCFIIPDCLQALLHACVARSFKPSIDWIAASDLEDDSEKSVMISFQLHPKKLGYLSLWRMPLM